MAKKENIKVVQEELDPVTPEILASSIRKIAKEMQQIERSGLNRRALLVLLSGATKLPMKNIDYVLNALVQLEEIYCTKKPKSGG